MKPCSYCRTPEHLLSAIPTAVPMEVLPGEERIQSDGKWGRTPYVRICEDCYRTMAQIAKALGDKQGPCPPGSPPREL